MTYSLQDIEEKLRSEFGDIAVDYLFPQIEIIRSARNIPSVLSEIKLGTQRFYISYQMLQKWLSPVVIIQDELNDLENHLKELQYQMKFHIDEQGIHFWKDVIKSENPTIKALYKEILTLKDYILKRRQELITTANRHSIAELLGLILWPYSEYQNLQDSIDEVKRLYFSSNHYYKKSNLFTDALILNCLVEDVLEQRKSSSNSVKKIEDLIARRLTFRRSSEQLEWSKFRRNSSEGMFTESQISTIIRMLLPNASMKDIFPQLRTFYNPDVDKYPIGKFLEWLQMALREETVRSQQSQYVKKELGKKEYVIGLSFLDKHRRQEIIGNIPPESAATFERILAPFNELKQDNAFLVSAQFEIENVSFLPSQAWIFDYSGVESEILRSTLLLISDRQPKFNVLEACQRLSNIILSGRVDRDDIKVGNYTHTNELPRRIWKYLSDFLVEVLEENLVREEGLSLQILKNIFMEEDRSKLVTSRRFIPVFQVDTQFAPLMRQGLRPDEMTIWARKDFDFQYRFALAGGYPWIYQVNELLESLVISSMDVPSYRVSQVSENVKLRQVVYTIDDQIYIAYYGIENNKVSALVFKETDLTDDEGIDPVEVIFRPHKFLGMGPEKNNLHLILEKARASDPKDLQTIISNLVPGGGVL